MSLTVNRKGNGLRRALFLCADNYLVGRFCEELFNSLVRGEGLNWQAVSRAYAPAPARGLVEPMAPEAISFLREAGAAPVNHRRLPLAVMPFDLDTCHTCIALAPRDQYAAIMRAWPEHAGQFEFWAIDPALPVAARLRECAFSVGQMVDRLLGHTEVTSARRSAAAPGRADEYRSAKLGTRSVAASRSSHARISDPARPPVRPESLRGG